jgi:hypothetical protein
LNQIARKRTRNLDDPVIPRLPPKALQPGPEYRKANGHRTLCVQNGPLELSD